MNPTLVDNTTLVRATDLEELPVPETKPRSAREMVAKAIISPWGWAAISCTILAISGGVRTWRDWEYEAFAQENSKCPFVIADLPRVLGSWRAIGKDEHLNEEIARLAGSSDHVLREYQDVTTGERVSVLVLYGIANSVFAHRPEICFTGAGFQAKGPSGDHQLTVPDSTTPIRYRIAYFSKTSGGIQHEVEVCHTFLHNKEWLPYLDSRWKMFRHHPAMCKIQIERAANSSSLETSPSVSILTELVEAINRRLADAEKSGRAGAAAAPALAESRP